MSTKALTVALRAQVWLSSRLQRMPGTQLHNSMATTGKVGCWKSEKTDLLVPQAEALEVVAALEAASADVEGSVVVAGSVAEVALEVASAGVAALVVAMVVLLLAATVLVLELGLQLVPPLLLRRQTLSLTSLPLAESVASSSMSATYVTDCINCLRRS